MQATQKNPNPLSQWYRQPKIFINLPSRGEYYPPGTLDRSVDGKYPVFGMTAKDELMIRTPDALISGQSTVEVIKSCVPSITAPWFMPSIDLDAVLVAIRIASFGEEMEMTVECPHCGAEGDYFVNLTTMLDHLNSLQFKSTIDVAPLTVHIRPYTYKEATSFNLKRFEQQRIINLVNDDSISDEEKLEKFNESFKVITALNIEAVASIITQIDTPDGSSNDPQQIRDFIQNTEGAMFDKISKHIEGIKKNMEVPPQSVNCSSCSKPFQVPLVLDHSNFFAVRS